MWGGGKDCRHDWITKKHKDTREVEGSNLTGRIPYKEGEARINYTDGFCSLCGAWKGAYGLEPTPEMYVHHTVEILWEIRRVLRKDGVVFWNIGDSYASQGGAVKSSFYDVMGGQKPRGYENSRRVNHKSIKPKDLCLIPFRVAIAAQEDGWWVRSIIIWNKPNPMPESVTDRPTESHEYILMLTKSGAPLFWTHRDHEGTREKPKADYRWVNQINKDEVDIAPGDWKVKIKCPVCEVTGKVNIHLGLDVWQEAKCTTCNGEKETQLWKRINLWRGHDYYWDAEAVRENHNSHYKTTAMPDSKRFGGDAVVGNKAIREERIIETNGRNLRSVWTFATQPFPEAHFAVFPEKLPELCIKAATPGMGVCAKCGVPWDRITEHKNMVINKTDGYAKASGNRTATAGTMVSPAETKTIGWKPTCKCKTTLPPVPATVLDPFMGAGTTLWAAKKLNRKSIGFDISGEYCELSKKRIYQQSLL